jgi:hypothetical protein
VTFRSRRAGRPVQVWPPGGDAGLAKAYRAVQA